LPWLALIKKTLNNTALLVATRQDERKNTSSFIGPNALCQSSKFYLNSKTQRTQRLASNYNTFIGQ